MINEKLISKIITLVSKYPNGIDAAGYHLTVSYDKDKEIILKNRAEYLVIIGEELIINPKLTEEELNKIYDKLESY